ncbi:MAG: KH domain-containing protein [Candidatus Methanogranum gryphiswaldense]|jgi:ribosomal RNA assembly protein|nr:MAG: KH domain-containing protein [Candidatus Methanogranum sp. U3.2.1]
MRSIRIPADRVGTIIGKNGETKRMIERIAGIRMKVNTEGEVTFNEEAKGVDPLKALQLMDVIKAIGRGINPDKATRLFENDEYLEAIDLKDLVGDRPNQLGRVRGRLIGTDGKTRQLIEDLTGCCMSVYGNTVCLIGNSVSLPVAKHAVELILNGSEHATVYHYLESQRPRLRISEMGFDI